MRPIFESSHKHSSGSNTHSSITRQDAQSTRKSRIIPKIVVQSKVVKRKPRSRSTSTSPSSPSSPPLVRAPNTRSRARRTSSYSSASYDFKASLINSSTTDMSKLSDGLKALISAAHARPGYTRAPSNIKSIFTQIARDAKSKNIGLPAWVTISTATSMTLNCPEAMTQLLAVTREVEPSHPAHLTAELIREVGLKCISFNGIPRSINCLGAFYDSIPSDVKSQLSTTPSREFTAANIDARKSDGMGLWTSVYAPFESKLLSKLARSHPDLPVHILNSHYANLLSDPSETRVAGAKVGRVLTSLVAIACLRTQTGVGPQVTSHVFGLRKAFEQGGDKAEGEEVVDGGEWLAGEEGNRWILETVDRIIRAVVGDVGTTFAPGLRAKL